MSTVEITGGDERGIGTQCADCHVIAGSQPGYRTARVAGEQCGTELDLTTHDPYDWRELTELC